MFALFLALESTEKNKESPFIRSFVNNPLFDRRLLREIADFRCMCDAERLSCPCFCESEKRLLVSCVYHLPDHVLLEIVHLRIDPFQLWSRRVGNDYIILSHGLTRFGFNSVGGHWFSFVCDGDGPPMRMLAYTKHETLWEILTSLNISPADLTRPSVVKFHGLLGLRRKDENGLMALAIPLEKKECDSKECFICTTIAKDWSVPSPQPPAPELHFLPPVPPAHFPWRRVKDLSPNEIEQMRRM